MMAMLRLELLKRRRWWQCSHAMGVCTYPAHMRRHSERVKSRSDLRARRAQGRVCERGLDWLSDVRAAVVRGRVCSHGYIYGCQVW